MDGASMLPKEFRHMAIAEYYMEELDAPPKEDWCTFKGTIYDIYTGLSWLSHNNHKTIKMVLKDLTACFEAGVIYTGKKLNRNQDRNQTRLC